MRDQNQPNFHIRKFGPKIVVRLDGPSKGTFKYQLSEGTIGLGTIVLYIQRLHYKYVYMVYN